MDDVESGYQDYGMRDYDAKRKGFERVDPLTGEYAFYSPYHFAGNSPIANYDLDGGEPMYYNADPGRRLKPPPLLVFRKNKNAAWHTHAVVVCFHQQPAHPINLEDTVANSGYGTDITNQQAGNYAYDPIGNMVSDIAGGITGITWTVYGKIDHLTKKASGTVNYTYDASGNRISKAAKGVETWYVRDATGNVMATYTKGDVSINSGNLTQAEVDLYGSSRLGLLNTSVNCSNNNQGPTALGNAWDATYNRGQKLFELTNHLGNVLATTTDRLVPVPDASNTFIDHNLPDVTSANDYYAFGMAMPGRSYSAGTQYRYGFNGKENDRDISEGAQDYGMRVYDGRLAKFLSVDPLSQQYPWYTPYQFAGNKPIAFIDRDGEEESGATFAMQRDEENYLAGKMTAEKLRENQKARGVGALIGGALVFDAYVTKGKLTQFLIAQQFFGAFHDNPASNPEVRKAQEKESRATILNVGIALGTGYVLGKAFSLFEDVISIKNPAKNMVEIETPTAIESNKILADFSLLKFDQTPNVWQEGTTMGQKFSAYYGKEKVGEFKYTSGKGLEIEINLPKELQDKGIGPKIFDWALAESEATKFTATWVKSSIYETTTAAGQSINLDKYNAALKRFGGDVEKAAFSTWSGGQAKDWGFTHATVTPVKDGVQATFTK